MAELEQKIDLLHERLTQHFDRDEEKDRDLERHLDKIFEELHSKANKEDLKEMGTRVHKLESFSDRMKGAIAFLGAIWIVALGWLGFGKN